MTQIKWRGTLNSKLNSNWINEHRISSIILKKDSPVVNLCQSELANGVYVVYVVVEYRSMIFVAHDFNGRMRYWLYSHADPGQLWVADDYALWLAQQLQMELETEGGLDRVIGRSPVKAMRGYVTQDPQNGYIN